MYKVLIADDERLIRITLKNMIDWKALDCEVIATAKDGEEAFHIFTDIQPEIVITDLKMRQVTVESTIMVRTRSPTSAVSPPVA